MPFIGLEHFDAFGALSPCFTGAFWIWYTRPTATDEKCAKQAGAEFGQAQQLVFQIWGWFVFCCQRPAKS